MSCPRELTVAWQRLAETGPEAELLRDEIRDHLRVCAPCRRRAAASDPSLIFLALPEVSVSSDEIARMRERVAGARRLLEAPSQTPVSAHLRLGLRWGAAAAVPLLVGALTWGALGLGEHRIQPTAAEAAREADRALVAEHLERLPLVEGSQDVHYQVAGDDFDVVLVVDAGLDLGGP